MADFPLTDAGNAEKFADVYKGELRYDHSRKRWLAWRKHWWVEDTTDQVYLMAISVARMRLQEAMRMPDGDDKVAALRWAVATESRAKLEAMLSLAQSQYALSDAGDKWDSDPWLVGVSNGVVDLHTGLLRAGKPADMITMHLDVPFDPEARCPRWQRYLQEVFCDDRELIDFVQRAMGYCLTGDTTEQCVFLCYGTGANGKSTFLEVARHVLGPYAFNLPMISFDLKARAAIPNDIAALVGKRFVTSIETNESAELNEARLKGLTGGDEVTARFFYREFFGFRPQAKFWLAFNHKPQIADDSHGLWRRLRLIPFLRQFGPEQADKNLLATLKAEASGILAWMVQGCLKWRAEDLEPPAAVARATEEYKEESDLLADFLEELYIKSPGAWEPARAVFSNYQHHSNANSGTPLSRPAFTRRMEAKGFKKTRRGHDRTWVWEGLKLRIDPYFGPYLNPDGALPRADADVKSPIVGLKEETNIMERNGNSRPQTSARPHDGPVAHLGRDTAADTQATSNSPVRAPNSRPTRP
jgi:putative DNA primase/helicase